MSIISSDIDKAAHYLNNNQLVAIPTETVYGLAGNIYSEIAIKSIFEIKKRPRFNPLIVHIHSIDQLSDIVTHVPEKAKLLAENFWPGSLTLVLDKSDAVPDIISAGKPTVAIRIPQHDVTLKLLRSLTFPLAAPSANPFNRISPTTAEHVEAYFGDSIPMILQGGSCDNGLESTIVGFDGETPVINRLGALAVEEIESVVGPVEIKNNNENSPSAPGMLKKHYSPITPLKLVDSLEGYNFSDETLNVIALKFTGVPIKDVSHCEILSRNGDLKEAAANLYAVLHKLDSMDADIIIAERLPNHGLGKAINDRLSRAAN